MTYRALNLKSVPTLGNLMGQPSVWVAIRFSSDDTINDGFGALIDDVLLRKCVVTSCPALADDHGRPADWRTDPPARDDRIPALGSLTAPSDGARFVAKECLPEITAELTPWREE